jgi:hypothetical protein
MEGRKSFQQSLSIADSQPLYNAKMPENQRVSHSLTRAAVSAVGS